MCILRMLKLTTNWLKKRSLTHGVDSASIGKLGHMVMDNTFHSMIKPEYKKMCAVTTVHSGRNENQ